MLRYLVSLLKSRQACFTGGREKRGKGVGVGGGGGGEKGREEQKRRIKRKEEETDVYRSTILDCRLLQEWKSFCVLWHQLGLRGVCGGWVGCGGVVGG